VCLQVGVGRVERCSACDRPVFLAERLVIGGKLRHRSCFKCARCQHLLNPVSCYETETGDFVCEMCPDEGKKTISQQEAQNMVEESVTEMDSTLPEKEIPAKPPDLTKTKFLNDILDGDKTEQSVNVTNFNDSDPINEDNSVNRLSESLDKVEDMESIPPIPTNIDIVVSSPVDEGDEIMSEGSNKDIEMEKLPPVPLTAIAVANTSEENKDVAEATTPEKNNEAILVENTSEENKKAIVKAHSSEEDKKTIVVANTFEEDKKTVVVTNTSEEDTEAIENKLAELVIDKGEELAQDSNGAEDLPTSVDETALQSIENMDCQNGGGDFVAAPETTPCLEEKHIDSIEEGLHEAGDSMVSPKNDEPLKETVEGLNPTSGECYSSGEVKSSPKKPDPDYPTSMNPFGDSDDEEEDEVMSPVRSAQSCRKVEVNVEGKTVIEAPKHLNPFWSESDEEEEEEETKPVPAPRTLKTPEPIPRNRFGSATSLTSQLNKKKRPAPPPPPDSTLLRSPSNSQTNVSKSPATTRRRKSRAPPPPSTLNIGKEQKDFENKVKQNLSPDKSTYGKWKRKKGAAPGLPVPPQKRMIPAPFFGDIHQEAEDLEVQQAELERQGVQVEQNIRVLEEKGDSENSEKAIEEMVLQLFEIVNQKNELFRRQAELMFL